MDKIFNLSINRKGWEQRGEKRKGGEKQKAEEKPFQIFGKSLHTNRRLPRDLDSK